MKDGHTVPCRDCTRGLLELLIGSMSFCFSEILTVAHTVSGLTPIRHEDRESVERSFSPRG